MSALVKKIIFAFIIAANIFVNTNIFAAYDGFTTSDFLKTKGIIAYKEGNYELALSLLDKYLLVDKKDNEVKLLVAISNFNLKNYEKAKEIFSSLNAGSSTNETFTDENYQKIVKDMNTYLSSEEGYYENSVNINLELGAESSSNVGLFTEHANLPTNVEKKSGVRTKALADISYDPNITSSIKLDSKFNLLYEKPISEKFNEFAYFGLGGSLGIRLRESLRWEFFAGFEPVIYYKGKEKGGVEKYFVHYSTPFVISKILEDGSILTGEFRFNVDNYGADESVADDRSGWGGTVALSIIKEMNKLNDDWDLLFKGSYVFDIFQANGKNSQYVSNGIRINAELQSFIDIGMDSYFMMQKFSNHIAGRFDKKVSVGVYGKHYITGSVYLKVFGEYIRNVSNLMRYDYSDLDLGLRIGITL